MFSTKYVFLALVMLINIIGHCSPSRDYQTWGTVTRVGKLACAGDDRCWKTWLEGQLRMGDDSSRRSQTILRAGIGYDLTPSTSLWLGYAWIDTGIPFTTNPFIENRIWQQLLWIKHYTHLNLMSRTRTEQRLVKHFDRPAYRIRQMLKVLIPFRNKPDWSVVASDEIFWHKNNFIGQDGQGFDQNRVFIGLGYKITPAIIAEMGYLNQYIHRSGAPNVSNNVAAINLALN